MEHIEELNVRVVKSDETREPFDREKIRRGIERACSKRSVPSEQIESIVQKIEAAIYSEFDFEIPATQIGEVVMRFLADVDEVAYIRFASVYREFENAKDFLRVISGLPSQVEDAIQGGKTSVAKNGQRANAAANSRPNTGSDGRSDATDKPKRASKAGGAKKSTTRSAK